MPEEARNKRPNMPPPGTMLSVTIKQTANADGNVSTHVAGTHGDPLVNLMLLSAGQQLLLDKMAEMNIKRAQKKKEPLIVIPQLGIGKN